VGRHVAEVAPLLKRLIDLALRGLSAMYSRDAGLFVFCRRRAKREVICVGTSLRYSAIVLLGARYLPEDAQRAILGGQTASEFGARLLARAPNVTNLGDAALLVWAGAELGVEGFDSALTHFCALLAQAPEGPTVEIAWALAAALAAHRRCPSRRAAQVLAERLLRCWAAPTGLFSHWTNPIRAPWYRRHAACFADQVYSIQALARFHATFDCQAALDAAAACALRLVALQGSGGQWWWQYDWRTGSVLEEYPVYTVHQDAMAPMALFDLLGAGGPDLTFAIGRGLLWLLHPPKVNEELIADDLALVWRSVRRPDPWKSVRRLRALTTALRSGVRFGALDRVFPPRRVDHEDRPYHLGWILYAWLPPQLWPHTQRPSG